MIQKIFAFLERLDRKNQLSKLKNNPNASLKGNIKIGLYNRFILYPNIKQAIFGDNLDFRDNIHIIVQKNASLEIEDRVFLNNFCSINCLDSIKIGENTLFGENVKLYDHNHAYESFPERKISHSEFTTAPIIIGKNCWLGSNVTILKGVKIGDGSIIGAGCTISKSIPENSTVVNKQELIKIK